MAVMVATGTGHTRPLSPWPRIQTPTEGSPGSLDSFFPGKIYGFCLGTLSFFHSIHFKDSRESVNQAMLEAHSPGASLKTPRPGPAVGPRNCNLDRVFVCLFFLALIKDLISFFSSHFEIW